MVSNLRIKLGFPLSRSFSLSSYHSLILFLSFSFSLIRLSISLTHSLFALFIISLILLLSTHHFTRPLAHCLTHYLTLILIISLSLSHSYSFSARSPFRQTHLCFRWYLGGGFFPVLEQNTKRALKTHRTLAPTQRPLRQPFFMLKRCCPSVVNAPPTFRSPLPTRFSQGDVILQLSRYETEYPAVFDRVCICRPRRTHFSASSIRSGRKLFHVWVVAD